MNMSFLERLQQLLQNNAMSDEISFNDYRIADEYIPQLRQGLQEFTALTKLYLINTSLSANGAKAIDEGLEFNNIIRIIDFNENLLGDEGVFHLKKTLEKLFSISFSANNISEQGVKHIIDALNSRQDYCPLFSLNISENAIGDNGIKLLSDNLELFEQLYLKNTAMTIEGVNYLCDALKTNTTVTVLDLSSCKLGKDGAFLLGEALKINQTLTTLILSNNGIGEGIVYLSEALKVNKTLNTICLLSNRIGEGVKFIAEALKVNETLTTLVLNDNQIGEGVKDIDDALKINTSLLDLYIDNTTEMFAQEKASIGKSLQANKEIKYEANCIAKANLIGEKTGKFNAPSLLKIGLFSVHTNFKSPEQKKQIEELPNDLKDGLKQLEEASYSRSLCKSEKQ